MRGVAGADGQDLAVFRQLADFRQLEGGTAEHPW